jgi:hypothetical protein
VSFQAIIQNLITFVTSTLGLSLITVALALAFAAYMCRMCYFHTIVEVALGAAGLVAIVATVGAIYG